MTITVVISGASNNYDICVYDKSGTEEQYSSNGTYTYEGTGVDRVFAYDFDTSETLNVEITDPSYVVIDFGGEVGDTSLHGTITFVGDDESVRPSTVMATHMATGNDYETVSFDVTGSSFEYSYGSGFNGMDDGLRFHDIFKYDLTTVPSNDTYCNEKNVTYTYTGSYKVTIRMEEGQLSLGADSSSPTFITVNLHDRISGQTIPVVINGSFDGIYWTGSTTLSLTDGIEVESVTSDDMSFINYWAESNENNGFTTYVGITGMISKTAADEDDVEKQTVTVTVSGTSGNNDIVVVDKDGSTHTFSSNGIHTYEGTGVDQVYAYDFGLNESGTVDIIDPFNVTITFGNGLVNYTVNVNIDFTSFDFSESIVSWWISNEEAGYTGDDIFNPTSDYSNSISIELPPDYKFQISGYPEDLTPVINKTAEGTQINYSITWSNGETPDVPTSGNTTYIYTNGTWRATATYIYTNGVWREVTWRIYSDANTVDSAILGKAVLGEMRLGKPGGDVVFEEEQNDYGTTVIMNSYTTEPNDHGTTVVIE